jgi:DNA replication and repair protein RecF
LSSDIKGLSCKNFRSYRTLALNISSKFVVFYGDNGAGKTNILEAISLFSSNRGLRGATISDLNSIGSQTLSWNLELALEKNQHKTFLSTNVQNGRRIAKIDNAIMPTLSKFEEILWLLWVIPSMDKIFISSTADRRSFFDHLVSGYDKRHKYNLKKLSELQKERLHIIFHRQDESWLKILEEKISEKNIEITRSRLNFIELLHKTFKQYSSEFLRPILSISGIVESIYEKNDEENAQLEIAFLLKKSRYEDSEKQTTNISAQKTLWQTRHPQTNLESENCSTGEQKAFLISLILAVLRIYQQTRAGIPILLLDDLMMHLDVNRRSHLINELISLNVQTFFTGTDASFFDGISDIAQVYYVKDSICFHKMSGNY